MSAKNWLYVPVEFMKPLLPPSLFLLFVFVYNIMVIAIIFSPFLIAFYKARDLFFRYITREEYTAENSAAGYKEASAMISPLLNGRYYLIVVFYALVVALSSSGWSYAQQSATLCVLALVIAVLTAIFDGPDDQWREKRAAMSSGSLAFWYMLLFANGYFFLWLFAGDGTGVGFRHGRYEPYLGCIFPVYLGVSLRRLFNFPKPL